MMNGWLLNINVTHECNLKNKLRLNNTFYVAEKKKWFDDSPLEALRTQKHLPFSGEPGEEKHHLVIVALLRSSTI